MKDHSKIEEKMNIERSKKHWNIERCFRQKIGRPNIVHFYRHYFRSCVRFRSIKICRIIRSLSTKKKLPWGPHEALTAHALERIPHLGLHVLHELHNPVPQRNGGHTTKQRYTQKFRYFDSSSLYTLRESSRVATQYYYPTGNNNYIPKFNAWYSREDWMLPSVSDDLDDVEILKLEVWILQPRKEQDVDTWIGW